MLKIEGKLLLRIAAVGACSLSAHMALAASLAPQELPQVSVAKVDPDFSDVGPLAEDTAEPSAPAAALAIIDPRQAECVAKVIRHEAANQPEEGQFAVAQVIRTRMKDGRFPTTACGVVKQRGQFFDVDAYDPPRDDARWATAMRIAIATLGGSGEEVADGALFFHSAGASMPGRTRVARIADHTFYR